MAFIKREIRKVVEEWIYTCDFVWRPEAKLEELPGIRTCKNEVIGHDKCPLSWSIVRIVHSRAGEKNEDSKMFYFCPEHAPNVETRLARLVGP